MIDFLLDGLAQALELERELGAVTVEVGREAMASLSPPSAASSPAPTRSVPSAAPAGGSASPTAARPASPAAVLRRPAADTKLLDVVFVHDCPLSAQGKEMMAKIIAAMGRTRESAPIVEAPPIPPARIIVVLGSRAMKLYFPGLHGGPGQWLRTPEGREVLITYSPEHILRFGAVTPAVEKIKRDMWNSLKSVRQRCGSVT